MKIYPWLVVFLLMSCVAKNGTPSTPANMEAGMSIRYLGLGDSYTIGESVPENERWPVQLADRLKAENIPVEVTIIAKTGWTTAELWQGIQAAQPTPPYELVSLLIGVNNQYRGYSSEEYREEFRFLLNKAIEYAGGDKNRVFVVSIPDWGVTLFAQGRDRGQISKEIDLFNSINKDESTRAGIRYFDITPISRQPDPALVADDGLHPSGRMYTQWVDLVFPEIVDVLK